MDKVAVVDDLLECKNEELNSVDGKIKVLNDKYLFMVKNINKFEGDEWELPKPQTLMLAKPYVEKFAKPLVDKLKGSMKYLMSKYYDLQDEKNELSTKLNTEKNKVLKFKEEVNEYKGIADFYKGFEQVLCKERVGELLTCESDIVRKLEQEERERQERLVEKQRLEQEKIDKHEKMKDQTRQQALLEQAKKEEIAQVVKPKKKRSYER